MLGKHEAEKDHVFAIFLHGFEGEMSDKELYVIVLHENVLRIREVIGQLRHHPGNTGLDSHRRILENLHESGANAGLNYPIGPFEISW